MKEKDPGHFYLRCVFCYRFYRQQLLAPSEEDARSRAAIWPPPPLPGEEASKRLRGLQYTRGLGGTSSLP